ncbi:nuclease-related domain-containing protein [Oceanobacillus rekensis]|uniref:nuclease-related domain-containing protein n=1 Tax=Oceanobacillus rekensis TaxID=937927 RepID=UPI000B43C040|nr:nuclease-related domain-containing protein [Oceanobacillus rekensis]
MIIKKRTKPLLLKKYEALIPRLRKNFPALPEIQYESAKYLKGYTGEVKVDYYLSLIAEAYTILRDVCLNLNNQTFQLDNLVITPHAIYIIEVKNYSGRVIFDTILNQFTRDDGKREVGFNHPITQVEIQQIKLQNWLEHRGLPTIPIYYLIAFSEPTTKIEVIGDQQAIAKVVTRGENIPKKIMEMESRLTEAANYQHQKIGYTLLRECKEYDKNVMAKHGIEGSDLSPGVQCPECSWLGMERIYNNWICNRCNHQSAHAHEKSLEDYLLLISPWIKNAEFRRFLNIKSKNIATRLMRKSGLTHDKQRRRWHKK